MFGHLRDTLRARLAEYARPEATYLLLIPVVGVLTGVSALSIAHLMALLQHAFWRSGDNLLAAATAAPWWMRLLVPVAGGVTVVLISLLARRDVRGGGTASLVHALALRGGRISFREEMPGVVAGMLTVSSGGSLGREGPMIDFAAVLGSRLGRLFRLDTRQVQVLMCCGAGAAISAVYNAPIGGTILVMEILIGTFALDVFGPVVIASVISTLIFRGATTNLPRFVIPAYELVSVWELPGYLVLGILGGAFAALAIKSIAWVDDAFRKLPGPRALRPLIGFALLGVIGIAFPQVYGNGYEAVNLTLHQGLPLVLLLVLPVMKLLATAITRGGGGSGGIFTPTLMLGAVLGGAFGYGMHAWLPAHTAEYGAYALVGMGAVLAGLTHAPIMAIMMIFEQTNSYSIILPLMLVCIVSDVVARILKREPLHLDALRRRGVVLPAGPEASLMRTLRVADVMHDDVESVNRRAPFKEVVEYFLRTPRECLFVVDDGRRLRGAISLHAIKDTLTGAEALDAVIAEDLVQPFQAVTPQTSLADTMEAFWRQHAQRLAVVEDLESRTLIAWVSQRDVIGIYNREILGNDRLLARFGLRDPSGHARSVAVELPEGIVLRTLVVPPTLDGRTIGGLGPQAGFGVHVLQLTHYDPPHAPVVRLPGAASVVRTQDRLVVIGAAADIDRLQQTLQLETETPAL